MMCNHPRLMDTNGVITPFACGQCICCRINKSREWKHRILLEMTEHEYSSFLTLTYNDDNIPENGTLCRKHLTNFIKGMRKHSIKPLRYFGVGEYGELTYRPHYHLALFGWNPFNAHHPKKVWNKGFIQVGELNNNSASYLVGYQTSKIGKAQDTKLGPDRVPMFTSMSKQKGGLGIGAVKKMADHIMKNEHFKPGLIKTVDYGKTTVPLGRYLTKKLADLLGIDEREQLADFWRYQEEVFTKYMVDGTSWFEKLQEEDRPKRLAKEKRHKIYNSKRRIL